MAERGMVKRGAAAMLNSRAWPVVFQAGSAEVLAEACLNAALSDQVVVPRKITIQMIAAGWAAFRRDKPPVQLFGPGKAFVEAWDAMIAAAPASTAGEVTAPPREVESE